MADMTMCNGGNCPNRFNCYRFTAVPNKPWQAYFVGYPENKIEGGEVICSMFIENRKK